MFKKLKTVLMKQIDILRKRLYYQSHHRGMKEMDMLLGGFAQQHLQNMNEEELHQFEDLLAFPDQDLYGWFFEEAPIPKGIPGTLIEMINSCILK
jgi:antitoxin CptB